VIGAGLITSRQTLDFQDVLQHHVWLQMLLCLFVPGQRGLKRETATISGRMRTQEQLAWSVLAQVLKVDVQFAIICTSSPDSA